MGVTISTHNGSAVAREHNIRNQKVVSKESHIDPQGTHETWRDESVRQAYKRLFGDAQRAYNARQSRPERKIDNYYLTICKDKKKHPVYEMIIGIYGKNDNEKPLCSPEQGKTIMKEFVDTWRERNPNLELIGAYYHADEEGEPHVHLDYIPVAHGYTRGFETQTGLVKALGEQGFEKKGKATAQIQWERRENDYLTSLCERVGLQVDHPRTEGIEHTHTVVYKIQKRVEQLERAAEQQQNKYVDVISKANEAEVRAADAESRAKGAENRVVTAENRLNEVNAQYDAANAGLKRLLDKKARASEIHKISDLFGETQTYHKNMLDATRAIGSKAYEELDKANKIRQEAISIQQAAERKEQQISPLHKKAAEEAAAAERERQQQQHIRETMEQRIEKRANEIADERIRQMFGETPSKREKRLEAFCEKLQFQDGTTALEKFEQSEKALLRKHSRGMNR